MMIRRQIKNPLLYISMILILVALFLGAKDLIEWYNQNLAYLNGSIPNDVNISAVQDTVELFSGYDVFMNGIGFGNSGFYPILIMIVIGFLFTSDFSQRLSDGSGINEIIRLGYGKYHYRAVVRNFISTFAFVFVVLTIFLIICVGVFSGTPPTEGHSSPILTASNLYYDAPMLYCLLQIINQAFFLALFSLLCMGTVGIYANTFVNRISPLIIYLFLTVASQMMHQFLGISLFVLLFPDLIFVPFNVDGNTPLGFVGEKIAAYILLIAAVAVVQYLVYKKYHKSYLK